MILLKIDKRITWTVYYYKIYNIDENDFEIKLIFQSSDGTQYIGYCSICDYDLIKDKHLVAHRHGNNIHMAYFYRDEFNVQHIRYVHHDIIPNVQNGYQIDHINTNGLDNRRYNLRIVTPSDNIRNTRLRSDNNTGRKGIQLHKWPNSDEIYQVEACVRDLDKNRIRKTWYVPKYGYENAIRLANDWLDEMQPKYNIRISRETSRDVHNFK